MSMTVRVTGSDYAYDGILLATVTKTSGELRYVVEDVYGRLSIQNAEQLGVEEGWTPVEEIGGTKWRALGPTKQSGMRCKDPVFWAYLREERNYENARNEDGAAAAVRSICGVTSRRDFTKPGLAVARNRWSALDRDFQSWKATEHAR
jgi:hypothetical protein